MALLGAVKKMRKAGVKCGWEVVRVFKPGVGSGGGGQVFYSFEMVRGCEWRGVGAGAVDRLVSLYR